MKEIRIEIPEGMDDKNSIFSYCLSFIKWKIWSDNSLKWNLKPLWDTELISEFNLIKEINSKLWLNYSIEDLSYKIRDFTRETGLKLDPIKRYNNVSQSKVYLVKDLDEFKIYILWNR